MNSKSLEGVDILKFICSILVVSIHTEPLRGLGVVEDIYNIFTRFAVPFFFFSSGYFLYGYKFDSKRINKQIIRLLIMYAIWTIIYFPILFLDSYRSGNGFIYIIKHILWDGCYTQFWYLVASIYAICLISLLFPLLNERKMLILAICIYYIGVLLSTYSPVFSIISHVDFYIYTRNAFFYGFPFIYFGMYYAFQKSTFLHEMRTVTLIMCFIACLFLVGGEGFLMIRIFHTKQTILWLCLPVGTALLFELAQRIHIESFDSVFFRKMSTLIYTSHCLFQFIVLELGIGKGIVQFLVVLASSVIFSIGVILSEKKVSNLKLLH